MKLKEQLRMLVILLAMPLAFVACDNNDDEMVLLLLPRKAFLSSIQVIKLQA